MSECLIYKMFSAGFMPIHRSQEVNEKTGFGLLMPTLYLQSIASIRQLVLNKSFAFMSESRVAETP